MEQDFVPDCEERAKLLMAGLGEKRIQLYLDADAEDIKFELYSHFPKLQEGGGFELLRTHAGRRRKIASCDPCSTNRIFRHLFKTCCT